MESKNGKYIFRSKYEIYANRLLFAIALSLATKNSFRGTKVPKPKSEHDQEPSPDQTMALSLLTGFLGAGFLFRVFLEKPNDLSLMIAPLTVGIVFSLIGFTSAIVIFVLCLFDSDKH